MTKITSKSSILDNSKEIDCLDSLREDYKKAMDNKQRVYLVTSDWRELEWQDFPKGVKVIRLTVDKNFPPNNETKDALYEQFTYLLSDDCRAGSEFTKLSTPDGKLAYISKSSPNHDETVARITQEWDK
jgi:hypothetical protein